MSWNKLITKPTLLLDKAKCLRNIEKMSHRARRANVGFRPHFKTHQSIEIGNWYRDFGVSRITVSSFDMAEYFARAGWQDILVAFPFNPLEINRLNELASISRMS
ncbi:MAG: alanine racemase, partial [Bacteroidales bacterium]|nr:alanine racemase [Bacteroidales bacterium]